MERDREAGPTVREASDGDRSAIADLVRRAMAEYRAADQDMHEAYLRYSLEPSHSAGADRLVAELDARVVGAVLFDRRVRNRPGWPSTFATFGTLVVDPNQRRRGIGAALTRACLERAEASGAAGVVIETMPFMTTGEAFYGPFGFSRWPEGDWDGTEIVREMLGRPGPTTILSAWRLDFPRASR